MTFLQGQVCGDVESLQPGRSQLTAVTSPRGRVIAIIRLLRRFNGCDLVLPRELADSLARRLTMYVLRARVHIELAGDDVSIFAFWGGDTSSPLPATIANTDSPSGLLALPYEGFLLITEMQPTQIEEQLAGFSHAGTVADWVVAETMAGIPETSMTTTETFIPQMLNLDLVGGVSFSKGCYVGQEVIARAHHLGKVKRRTRLFHLSAATPPSEGQSLLERDRAVGKIARIARVTGSNEGYFVLAVTSTAGELSLENEASSVIEERALPYQLPD